MMEKIISLIKTDFNTTFGLSSIAYSFKSKKNRWQIIVFGIAMLSLIPTYFLFVKSLGEIYDIYSQIGQSSMFLLLGFLGAQVIVFVLGLLYVMSKYYFSNDLALLLPLPVKPSYILGSKFATLMFSEYLTSLPIILPFIFIYGIRGGEGAIYWIYSFLLILTLPVIPLVLSSILVMFFMKYTNIGGKKDLIRTLSAVLFIILVVYVQLKINTITQKALLQGNDFLINLVKDSNLLVKKLGLGFPPSMWASLSLSNYLNITGLGYLSIFVGVGVLGFIVMILLSEGLFFDGLIGNIEVSASKGKTGRKLSIRDSTVQTKPYLALAKKEITMLFKTPIYLFNSIGGVIAVPIIMVMSAVTGGGGDKDSVIKFIESKPEFVALVGIGFITAMGMLNSIGATTFSREGKNFWIQRVLPIKARDQIVGRVLSSIAIQVLGLVALLGALVFVIRLRISTIALISVLGLLGSVPMTQIGMVIDIIRPSLKWTNPQQAMKQNFNVLFGMGLGTLYIGGISLLVFNLIDRIDINFVFLVLAVIFIISTAILYYALEKLIKKQFEVLE
ncbi:MAG: putative ABC transporter permease subunit [Natronincolaceae bacterium]|jgi:ABC-2 type transport system permease protein